MKAQYKALIALVLITGTAIWALSGSTGSAPFLDVHHVTSTPDEHTEDEISVRGNVLPDSIRTRNGTVRFTITDASGDPDQNHTRLHVVYDGVLPDAFGPKMVVVTGLLMQTPNGLIVQADDIQVGCSSKY